MTHAKTKLQKLEFYITNVCNLGCASCNRFNNLHFKGHSAWKDYAHTVSLWAEKLEIDHLVIMGGEPLLNPDINNWVVGLSKAFDKPVQIMSNGSRINKVPGLYEALVEADNSFVGISLHYPELKDTIYQAVRDFFPSRYPVVEKDGEENTVLGGIKSFQDNNNIHVEVWAGSDFSENSLMVKANGRYTLYNNNPKDAFRDCSFQKFKNYHWINGKIYRCGPVGLFPQLDDQFDLDLDVQDKALLRAYQPLCADDSPERHKKFFENIDSMIPQCKFCVAAPKTIHLSPDNDLKNVQKLIAKT